MDDVRIIMYVVTGDVLRGMGECLEDGVPQVRVRPQSGLEVTHCWWMYSRRLRFSSILVVGLHFPDCGILLLHAVLFGPCDTILQQHHVSSLFL